MSPKGETKFGNYEITQKYGMLSITPRNITLTSGTATMTYNGEAQKYENVNVTTGS